MPSDHGSGNDAGRPPCARRNAALPDRSIWKPPQSYSRVWLGGGEGSGGGTQGTLTVVCVAYSRDGSPDCGSQNVADLIGAEPKDVVFTSGATETNNMAIKGVARFHKEKKRHIITTQTVRHFAYFLVIDADLCSGAQVCA